MDEGFSTFLSFSLSEDFFPLDSCSLAVGFVLVVLTSLEGDLRRIFGTFRSLFLGLETGICFSFFELLLLLLDLEEDS